LRSEKKSASQTRGIGLNTFLKGKTDVPQGGASAVNAYIPSRKRLSGSGTLNHGGNCKRKGVTTLIKKSAGERYQCYFQTNSNQIRLGLTGTHTPPGQKEKAWVGILSKKGGYGGGSNQSARTRREGEAKKSNQIKAERNNAPRGRKEITREPLGTKKESIPEKDFSRLASRL